MTKVGNPLKIALRAKMKTEVLNRISVEARASKSDAITKKVIASEAFKNAEKISVYLSTSTEVDTTNLLEEMFNQQKQVFVPTYGKNVTEMVKLRDMCDYNSLPKTKQNIKQPNITDGRENALSTGGIDLFLVPGVAFTLNGGRMGYGMGFYDMYFKRHFDKYPERSSERMTLGEKLQNKNKSILMALAFKEQIIPDDQLPLDPHDFKVDYVVTEDDIYASK